MSVEEGQGEKPEPTDDLIFSSHLPPRLVQWPPTVLAMYVEIP